MAKNHALTIEVDLNCEAWLREMGKKSKNISLIKTRLKHVVPPKDKDRGKLVTSCHCSN